MASKTFSSRADANELSYMDALTREQFGMSFGQYCGSILIEAVRQGADLPTPADKATTERKIRAANAIKAIARMPHGEAIGKMSDDEIKDLIASRYE